MSLTTIHHFIGKLDRDPSHAAAFRSDPQQAMAAASLTEQEIELLLTASRESLAELGVHPLLQIRYLRARFPERGGFMSIKDWAARLPLEVPHG